MLVHGNLVSGGSDDSEGEVILGGDSWGEIVVSPNVVPSSELLAWERTPDSPVLHKCEVDGEIRDKVVQAILGVGERDGGVRVTAVDQNLVPLSEKSWVEVGTVIGVVVVLVDIPVALFPGELFVVLLESVVDVQALLDGNGVEVLSEDSVRARCRSVHDILNSSLRLGSPGLSEQRPDFLGSFLEITDEFRVLNFNFRLLLSHFLCDVRLLVVIGVPVDIVGISVSDDIVDQLLDLLAPDRVRVGETVSVELVLISVVEKLVGEVGVDLVGTNHIPIKNEGSVSDEESLQI